MNTERERRSSYRVSVRPHGRWPVLVTKAGNKWSARLGNISVEGVFLRFVDDEGVELEIGEEIELQIELPEESFVLRGTIRSKRAGGYGVSISPDRDSRGPNPHLKLARLSALLQREELARRSRDE